MGLLTLIVSFLLAIPFLLAPCASDQLNLKQPMQQGDHAKFAQPSLPRKLMNLNHDTAVKSSAEEDFTPLDKFRQASSGFCTMSVIKHRQASSGTKQREKEENVINAAEKEEEEEQGPNKSEYFTMDYGWVRRRRPIHNKQIPFVP